MLFNLDEDLQERDDLAAQKPELFKRLQDACEQRERNVSK